MTVRADTTFASLDTSESSHLIYSYIFNFLSVHCMFCKPNLYFLIKQIIPTEYSDRLLFIFTLKMS